MGAHGKGFLTLVGVMLALETWGIVLVIRHGRWLTCGSVFVVFVGLFALAYIVLWVWSVLK